MVNTGAVIDGITARVIGLPERQVTTNPPVLALFPEAAGRLTVSLGLPSAFPAGRHPLTVEMHSRQDGDRTRSTSTSTCWCRRRRRSALSAGRRWPGRTAPGGSCSP